MKMCLKFETQKLSDENCRFSNFVRARFKKDTLKLRTLYVLFTLLNLLFTFLLQILRTLGLFLPL